MLLKGYQKEIFRPKCNPGFQSVHCIAHLDQDVSEALPYLNTVLGGFEYFRDPPAVTFRLHGKLLTVHGRRIAVNALEDEAEAERILRWMQREINEAWEQRDRIQPSYEGRTKPKVLEVLKRLPKSNCGQCGQPTCMVFAVLVTEGAKTADECPALEDDGRRSLNEYLAPFVFED